MLSVRGAEILEIVKKTHGISINTLIHSHGVTKGEIDSLVKNGFLDRECIGLVRNEPQYVNNFTLSLSGHEALEAFYKSLLDEAKAEKHQRSALKLEWVSIIISNLISLAALIVSILK